MFYVEQSSFKIYKQSFKKIDIVRNYQFILIYKIKFIIEIILFTKNKELIIIFCNSKNMAYFFKEINANLFEN